jgi:RNA polymerase sigma-70 factor (ECF subfamily)
LGTRQVALATTSEAVLVRAAQAGDRAAFTELVRRRQGWLRALHLQLCGGAAEADDLAQETFLRAWRRLSQLHDPLAFSGWLRSMAVRLFVDSRRRLRLELDEMASFDGTVSADPTPDYAAGAKIDLDRALAMLTPVERLCIVLNLGEGLSHAEVKQLTELPLGTVKSHIARGVQKIRRAFGGADE